ncbi:unnamed protein product [Soboliphyme baturini]|uniref:CPSF_A domain-containing protein n=1 Tax=Soboliphyme baturini TaxID=241478 RepID=A0A183IH15_9BILA|nr:unnamed protein product [Soboliphyme baturini]
MSYCLTGEQAAFLIVSKGVPRRPRVDDSCPPLRIASFLPVAVTDSECSVTVQERTPDTAVLMFTDRCSVILSCLADTCFVQLIVEVYHGVVSGLHFPPAKFIGRNSGRPSVDEADFVSERHNKWGLLIGCVERLGDRRAPTELYFPMVINLLRQQIYTRLTAGD